MAVVINATTQELGVQALIQGSGQNQELILPHGTTYLGVDINNDIYAADAEPIISCGYVHPQIGHELIYVGVLQEGFLIKIPNILDIKYNQ